MQGFFKMCLIIKLESLSELSLQDNMKVMSPIMQSTS